MHLLHKRDLRINDPQRFQHAMDFFNTPLRVYYVLQDGLTDYPVKRSIQKWQIMCVCYRVHPTVDINITVYKGEPLVCEKSIQALSPLTGTNHQDHRTTGD